MTHVEVIPGHCGACDGPTRIHVSRLSATSTKFSCERHPELAHTISMPEPLPFGYIVLAADANAEPWTPDVVASVDVDQRMVVVHDTPQEATAAAERIRWVVAAERTATGVESTLTFAVAAVTLLEDLT